MTVPHIYIQSPEEVMPVRTVGRGHGVGDEGDSMGRKPESELDHGILHVESVVDKLDGDPRILHCRRNRAGVAVVQPVHGIEHMGHDSGSGVESFSGSLVVGIAVADRRNHSGQEETADCVDSMRKFRRDGDLSETPIGGVQHSGYEIRSGID